MIGEEPGRIERLQRFAKEAHEKLDKALQNTKFAVRAAEVSPMKHIVCKDEDRGSGESKLDSLVNTVSWRWEEGDDEWLYIELQLFEKHKVLLTRARYIEKDEKFPIQPRLGEGIPTLLFFMIEWICSVRFMVQSELTEDELNRAIEALRQVACTLWFSLLMLMNKYNLFGVKRSENSRPSIHFSSTQFFHICHWQIYSIPQAHFNSRILKCNIQRKSML
mgnify:CR=1 FL=1